MIYVILAFIAGTTIVFSRIVSFKLSEKIGIFQSTFFNNLIGLIFSILLLRFSVEFAGLDSIIISTDNLAIYLGGFLGVIVVSLSSYLTPKMSALYITLFMFLGQIFTAAFIDFLHFGTFSTLRVFGGVLVLAGLAYNLLIDKKYAEA